MPGRVAQAEVLPQAPTRRRTTARKRPAVEDIPDEGIDSSLRRTVCSVFADSQRSTAGHRKCVITLRKLQEQCCYEPVNPSKAKQSSEFDEDQFNNEFIRCVLRILMVKKSEPVGDRVVRFLGTYLNTAGQKDMQLVNQEDPDQTTLPETPTSRLTAQLLNTLLPLLTSKDKTVRFRTTQVISHIVNSLDSLDDHLFHLLRTNLLKRIHDKEAPVRLQAVYGLGRLAADVDGMDEDENSDSDRDIGSGVLMKLLNVLQNDPSAEVRRNLLLNLPLSKDVLPYLLERARDADSATRRALYARLLPALGDFRHLSLTHREKLLRWGLRDRDDAVRAATARLFRERWIENCAALPASQSTDGDGKAEQVQQAADPSFDALLELLERIDVINSGAENGIALIAMQEFWEGRPDYVSYVVFPDTFWQDLTPELAFVARTFNTYCRSPDSKQNGPRSLESLIEEKLPEVTQFGTILDRELQILIEAVRQAASGEDVDADEEAAQREFIVEQMLQMALTFDYSDEVGRRKMFGLMREALALPELPEEVTKLVVEVLRRVCGSDSRGEREFCGIVLEAVAEVHDTIMSDPDEADTSLISESIEDESFHSATSHQEQLSGDKKASKKSSKKIAEMDEAAIQVERERAVREIMVNMKCLHIAQCMLQNVACELEENVHLVTMLNNLIVPAVRSQEAPIRERGLVCLGLCCLLGKNLAEENLTLFMHCFTKGHPALQTIALQIIGDILVTHPSLILNNKSPDDTIESVAPDGASLLKQIIKAFSKSLKSGDATVQATGVTALAKTMLSRLITDADLLKQLVVAYFDPETSANAQLRQSLSYFLPVYCHSRTENAVRMVSVVCSILSKLNSIREAFIEEVADADDEDGGMVSLTTISNMLVDWTDPRRIYGFDDSGADIVANETSDVHFLLAETVLERLVTSQASKDERKILLSMLGKLYLPAGGCGPGRLKTTLELLTEAIDSKVATDATGRNVLSKLQTQLLKLMHDGASTERGDRDAAMRSIDSSHLESAAANASSTILLELEQEQEPLHLDANAEEDPVMAQLRSELRESTIGIPDAEGTRMMLHDDDDDDLLNSSEADE